MIDVLVVGDVGWDEYLDEPAARPGGCALNVACALRASGAAGRVAIAAPIGEDGEPLRAVLAAREVDVSLLSRVSGPTPRQRIEVRPDGEREFKGYEPGVLGGWRPDERVVAAVTQAGLVYVATFDVTRDLARTAWSAREGAPLALDLMNMSDHDDAFVEEAVGNASIVFAGLHAERDAARIERLAAWAARPHAALVIVTLGPRGALALSRQPRVERPAYALPGGKVVDTTGCGDAFAGAFLAARARGQAVGEAMDAGARLAAKVAAQRGAVV